jgi:hypothetical protein
MKGAAAVVPPAEAVDAADGRVSRLRDVVLLGLAFMLLFSAFTVAQV